MKKHEVKHYLNEGSEYDTYTHYKNNDPKLVKAIKDFKFDDSVVQMGFKEWNIEKYEETEVRCTSGKNVQYFPVEDVKKRLLEMKIEAINKEFDAYEEFGKQYGILSWYHNRTGSIFLKKCLFRKKDDVLNIGADHMEFSVNNYSKDKIEINTSTFGTMMFFDFDEDGNFKNRDYNIKLSEYEPKDISPSKLMKHFEKLILELGSFEYSAGKYFTKEFCYIPYHYNDRGYETKCGVEIVPVRGDKKTYQRWKGYPIYKKGKKTEKRSATDLLNDIKKLMPEEFINSFRSETAQHLLSQEQK